MLLAAKTGNHSLFSITAHFVLVASFLLLLATDCGSARNGLGRGIRQLKPEYIYTPILSNSFHTPASLFSRVEIGDDRKCPICGIRHENSPSPSRLNQSAQVSSRLRQTAEFGTIVEAKNVESDETPPETHPSKPGRSRNGDSVESAGGATPPVQNPPPLACSMRSQWKKRLRRRPSGQLATEKAPGRDVCGRQWRFFGPARGWRRRRLLDQLAEKFNAVVERNEAITSEIIRVEKAVRREGRMTERATVNGARRRMAGNLKIRSIR